MSNGTNDNLALKDRHAKVKEHVKFYMDLANDIYGTNLTTPDILFDLRGCTAGQAYNSRYCLRFNNVFLIEQWKDMLENTVPHEVAHIVARRLNPHRRIRPHGPEWRKVMRDFGVKDTVTHNYDVTNARVRKLKRYEYTCPCGKIFNLTSIKHNRIRKGQARVCRTCRGRVEWTGRMAEESQSLFLK